MRFRLEQRFAAPPAAVEDALTDPRFLARLALLPNLGGAELLRREVDGDLVHLDVRYAFAGTLSSAVTAVVDPDKLTWVDAATFDRASSRSEHRIVPDHYGSRLTCSYTAAVTAAPDGARRTVEGELKVHFPLVGGRVERAIVSGMEEHARLEAAALDDWIAEQG